MYFFGINLGQESAIQATTFYSVHLKIERIDKLLEIAFKTIGKYEILKLCHEKCSMEKIKAIDFV